MDNETKIQIETLQNQINETNKRVDKIEEKQTVDHDDIITIKATTENTLVTVQDIKDTVKELSIKIDKNNKDNEDRWTELDKKGSNNFSKLIWGIVLAVISAVVGASLAGLKIAFK